MRERLVEGDKGGVRKKPVLARLDERPERVRALGFNAHDTGKYGSDGGATGV